MTKYDFKNDKQFLKCDLKPLRKKKINNFIHNSLVSEWPYFAAVFNN